ncbi:hypothetical protein KP77_29000 [Jeotgalibacillus alimentarius]|uniref:Uncharacterized protein n=1 Tax=Jeotgalibacillus alimentarius TaxID=135826 RepID=A0A0C2RSE6_9BACL|nr:hypothetical protein KP77_29000 [Jeotgalibacillus alimentarius]
MKELMQKWQVIPLPSEKIQKVIEIIAKVIHISSNVIE